MNTFQANDWLSNRNQIFLNNNLFEKGSLINKISFRFSTKFKREQTQKIIEFVTLKLNTTHGAERNLYLDLGERYINHLKKDKKVAKTIQAFDRFLVKYRSEIKFALPKNRALFEKWTSNRMPIHIYKNHPEFCTFLESSNLLSQMKIALDKDLPIEVDGEPTLNVNGHMMKWSEIQQKFEVVFSEAYQELFVVEKNTREVFTYLPNGKGLQPHHPYLTERTPLIELTNQEYEKVLANARLFVRKSEENLSEEERQERNKERTFIIQIVTSYVKGPDTRLHRLLSRSKHPYLRIIVGQDLPEYGVKKGQVFEVGYNWKSKVTIPLVTTKGRFRSPDRWNYTKCAEKVVTNIPITNKEALNLQNYTLKYHRDGVNLGKEMGFNLAKQNCSSFERSAVAVTGVDIPTEISLSDLIAEIAPNWMRKIGAATRYAKEKAKENLKKLLWIFPICFRESVKKTAAKISNVMEKLTKVLAAVSLVPLRASLGGALGEKGVAFVSPGDPEKHIEPPLRNWKNWLKVTKINVPGILQQWQRKQLSTVVYKNPLGLTIVP